MATVHVNKEARMPISDSFMFFALASACFAVAWYCKRSLVREARGLEVHGHADGTVHEHHRGSVPHAHPTLVERYDRAFVKLWRTPNPAVDTPRNGEHGHSVGPVMKDDGHQH